MLKGSETIYSKLHDAVGKQLLGLMVNDPGHELQPKQEKLPTVYLTLDSKIQYVLEDAMDDAMERTKAKGAAAIIMDPYTGEIWVWPAVLPLTRIISASTAPIAGRTVPFP